MSYIQIALLRHRKALGAAAIQGYMRRASGPWIASAAKTELGGFAMTMRNI